MRPALHRCRRTTASPAPLSQPRLRPPFLLPPAALGVDDFMQRLEIALYAFGFSNDNSIGERGARAGCAALYSAVLCRAMLSSTMQHGGAACSGHTCLMRAEAQPKSVLEILLPRWPRLALAKSHPPCKCPLPRQPWSTCAAMRSPTRSSTRLTRSVGG